MKARFAHAVALLAVETLDAAVVDASDRTLGRLDRAHEKHAYSLLRPHLRFGILCGVFGNGEVAQLVEHHVRNVGVESSNLFFSTILRR